MKTLIKILSFVMLFVLVFSASGCNKSEYNQAKDLYADGKYKQAEKIFLLLDNYKDSSEMAIKSRYMIAKEQISQEEYDKALESLETISGYEDSEQLIKDVKWNIIYKYLVEKGERTDLLNGLSTNITTGTKATIILCAKKTEQDKIYFFASQDITLVKADLLIEITKGKEDAVFNGSLKVSGIDLGIGTQAGFSEDKYSGTFNIKTATKNTKLNPTSFSRYSEDIYGNVTRETTMDSLSRSTMDGLYSSIIEGVELLLTRIDDDFNFNDLGFENLK